MGEMPGTHGCLDSATFLFWVLHRPGLWMGKERSSFLCSQITQVPCPLPFPVGVCPGWRAQEPLGSLSLPDPGLAASTRRSREALLTLRIWFPLGWPSLSFSLSLCLVSVFETVSTEHPSCGYMGKGMKGNLSRGNVG